MPAHILILSVVTAMVLAVLFTPRVFRRPLPPGRRFWLGVLQLSPLLAVVWLLGNPTSIRTHQETVKQTVALLIDDSPSMAFEDGESGKARYEVLQSWSSELLQEWKQSSRSAVLETFLFSDLIPEGHSASDIAAVIEGLQNRIPKDRLAAVIIASDGQDHGERSAAQTASQLGVPVHTLGTGPVVAGESIKVRWLETPETATPGSPFMIRWGVDSKQSETWAGQVRITSGSQEIACKEISLQPGDGHLEEWASLKLENSGKHILHLLVESARTGDRVDQATASILVKQDTPTLLILESQFSRLTQSLSQTLLEGGRYRVLHALSSPDGGGVFLSLFRPAHDNQGKEPWSHERVLRKSSVEWEDALGVILPEVSLVVLGRSVLNHFPRGWASLLDNHLQHSQCGILVLPGAEEGLDRLSEGGLRSFLTWTGRRSKSYQPVEITFPTDTQNHPAMAPVWMMLNQSWKTVPDESFDGTPPYARILMMDIAGNPLLYESRVSLSRALAISLSDLWTLRSFDTSQAGNEKRFVEGLWLGLVDYLAVGTGGKADRLHVRPNPASVGQTVQVLAEAPSLPPGPAVSGIELRRMGESSWRILPLGSDPEWPGLGRASWIPRESGFYEIRFASGEEITQLRVLDHPPELEDRLLNQEILAAISARSGGQYVPFSGRDALFADMDAPSRTMVRSGQISFRHDAWTGILLVLLFCTGWGVRRLLSLP